MTPADLYAMVMESDTAGNYMHEICRALKTPYPPRPDDYTELCDFQKGLQPPVSAAIKEYQKWVL